MLKGTFKTAVLRTCFALWVVLWLWFVSRGLFIKGDLERYKILMSRDLDGKRSYVTGDRFYGFLMFCKSTLPEGATYGLAGLKEGSVDMVRAVYYLYPNLKSDDPEFIITYSEDSTKESE